MRLLAAATHRLAVASAAALAFAAATAQEPLANARRDALLAAGQAALERADVPAARMNFEQAAAMQHAADSELGVVRSLMQAGDYRQALAFAAHTAAHREAPEAGALYAWLLAIGGQTAFALQQLDAAIAHSPGNDGLLLARARLQSKAPLADGALRELPWHLAPYSVFTAPAGARIAGGGVLIDGGRHALVPLATLDPGARDGTRGNTRLWLRNGLGAAAVAQVERRDEALALALLKLDPALESPAGMAIGRRDPFPGSPGFVIGYAGQDLAAAGPAWPAWPILREGFVGKPEWSGGWRALGIEQPPGDSAGPVFDAQGAWAGIALRASGADGEPRFAPVSLLRRSFGDVIAPVSAEAGMRATADAVYERGLRMALQLITAP